MKKIIKFLALLLSFFFILLIEKKIFTAHEGKTGESIEEPTRLKNVIEEKLKQAKEAKVRAEQAEEKAKTAEIEMEKNKSLAADTSLREEARKQASIKQKEWQTTAQSETDTKKKELETEKKLNDEALQLTKEQNQLATEFIKPNDENKEDVIKEQFEKCVKKHVMDNLDEQKLKSPQAEALINELSKKLGELTLYEQINFFDKDNSERIQNEQWKKLHQDAIANPNKYDPYYVDLLKAIYQIRLKISEIVKQDSINIPTATDNDECIIKNYPALYKKLQQLQQIENENVWNN